MNYIKNIVFHKITKWSAILGAFSIIAASPLRPTLQFEHQAHIAVFNADQCERLHGEYIRLMESKSKYDANGEVIPSWLVEALIHNTTKKNEFGCEY